MYEIAGFYPRLQATANQRTDGADRMRPGRDEVSGDVHTSLKTVQPLFFDEIASDLRQVIPRAVVAEAKSHCLVQVGIRVTRSVAVAVLDGHVGHAQEHQGVQVRVS